MESSHQHSYIDEYRVIKTLGSGYHAKVKLVQFNGKQFAVKRFKRQTADLQTLKHQLSIMSQLDHPNIAKLIEVRENAIYKKKNGKEYPCLAIVLQYINGGELFQYVATCGKFSQNVARTYFHMLIDGLEYMHKRGIAHRDIKPENILLDQNFNLKITDFGFSTFLERGVLHTKLGTEGYMAPEIRNKNYNGQTVDLFAATVILFIMYSGNPPFGKANPTDPYYKIFSNKNYNVFWGAHSKKKENGFYPDSFKDFINKMLSPNVQQRLNVEQIKAHPWYNGDIVMLNQIKTQFKKRKEAIDKKLQEQRQEKRKKKNILFQTTRSRDVDTQNQTFHKIFDQILLNESLLKTTHQKTSKFFKCDPKFLVAVIKTILQQKSEEENFVIGDFPADATESYQVNILEDSGNVKITGKFMGQLCQEEEEFNVEFELCWNESKNIVMRWNKNKFQGNYLYCQKLVNIVENQVEFLR